jgi:hypothetical protein
MMIDPVGRQIDSAAVATGFDLFLDHLFPVDFEFDFGGIIDRGSIVIFCLFVVWHGVSLFNEQP